MTEGPERVPVGTSRERHTETRWAHRDLGGLWLLALLLVPLLLAGLLAAVRGGPIGDDLRERSMGELDGAGLSGVDIEASGRDLTLTSAGAAAMSAADVERARDLVGEVDGVRVVNLGDGMDAGSADAAETPTEAPSETPTETPSETPVVPEGGSDCEAGSVQAAIDQALGADFVQFDELRRIPDQASKGEIAAVSELLAPCADLGVTVTGYTDKLGSQPLSQARAINVTTLLTDAGVTNEISKVGGHFSRALGDNETPAGRDQNRFATITVK